MKKANSLSAGFTLVELAVVLVLMGLISAMVIPSFANREGDPIKEAERFAAVLNHTAEASILSGTSMGVEITSDQYRILRNRRGLWVPADNDPAFRVRSWSAGLEVLLRRGGAEITSAVPGQPTILFRSTGEATPFSILLTRAQAVARVDGDALGGITVRALQDG